jgi:hypothetical protein
MGMYAYHSTTESPLEVQQERAKRLKLDEMLRAIEGAQASVANNLGIWLRSYQHPKGQQQAKQAMDRLIEARQEENRLFRELFGIADDRLAIGKR